MTAPAAACQMTRAFKLREQLTQRGAVHSIKAGLAKPWAVCQQAAKRQLNEAYCARGVLTTPDA